MEEYAQGLLVALIKLMIHSAKKLGMKSSAWSHFAAALLTYRYWPEDRTYESGYSSLREAAEVLAVELLHANGDDDRLRRLVAAREEPEDLEFARAQMARLNIELGRVDVAPVPPDDDGSA